MVDHRYYRLTSRPAHVTIWPRVSWVGGHQPLLYGEDEIVSGPEGRRRHWGIVPAQANLKCADGLAQGLWCFGTIVEMECFDIVKQPVGLREQ
jgi:hypothetical protein